MFDGGFDFAAWHAGPPSSDEEEGVAPGEVGGAGAAAAAAQVGASMGVPGTMPRPPSVRSGDWSCSCGNVNFARRTRCNKCGLKKSDDMVQPVRVIAGRGRAVPKVGKVPPASSPGDWVCWNCMNHNWARREVCNICQSARPTTVDQGPRLGRGKGHCDIQDPKEKQTHDSDEEVYDEFGRKKRKGQMSRKIAPQQLKKIADHMRLAEMNNNAQQGVNDKEGHDILEYLSSGLLFPPAPADAVIPWQLKEQILEEEAERIAKQEVKISTTVVEEGEVVDSEK